MTIKRIVRTDFFKEILHIYTLAGFALAQPLFDLLSKNAEFFIAHDASRLSVFLLTLILCALLPTILILFEWGMRRIHVAFQKVTHVIFIAVLTAAIALPILVKFFQISGVYLTTGAVLTGVFGSWIYGRFVWAKNYLTVLSPAVIVFPALFLFFSPVYGILFPTQKTLPHQIRAENSPPIILVVFDEFPLSSLMDENREIDGNRYPNFAEFAKTSYWFRNYTTVGERTEKAIPAILTGLFPYEVKLPTETAYPNNLFTLLGGTYDILVHEPDTRICPKKLISNTVQTKNETQILLGMLTDLSLVYLHLLLPSDLTAGLPSVTLTWNNFMDLSEGDDPSKSADGKNKVGMGSRFDDRSALFTRFVDLIEPSEKPRLYFFHSRLPHLPWQYLPTGKVYKNPVVETPGLNNITDQWSSDEWLVIQAHQRHLLQVGYVDKLIGKLVARLKAVDLFDASLIIVTADHGISFWPNQVRRLVYTDKPMDIISVPFFVKIPHQAKGVISDRNAESIDVLPTITDVLGESLPWQINGESVLNLSNPERDRKTVYNFRSEKILFKDSKDFYEPGLKRKLSIFGSGSKPDGIYRIGRHGNYLFQQADQMRRVDKPKISTAEVIFSDQNLFDSIDDDSAFIPAQIKGKVIFDRNETNPMDLAISVNNTLYAMTRTFWHEENRAQFSAMVPESAFHKGKNEVEVYWVSGDNGHITLARLGRRGIQAFSLKSAGRNNEFIVKNEKTIPVVSKKIKGWLDKAWIENDRVYFYGWAVDVKKARHPDHIVAFKDGKFLYAGETTLERPDVAAHFDNLQLKRTGFSFSLPVASINPDTRPEIRLFAVSEDVSTELFYPKGYSWSSD